MPNYEIVTKELHQTKRWIPSSNFLFAARDALCPIVALEVPSAAMYLPIAFSKVGDHFDLFVIQGLQADKNYLVDAEGTWLAGYIPAPYRAYPFALARTADEQMLLCVATESLSDNEGNALFNEDGSPGGHVQSTMEFLSKIEQSRAVTRSMCALLHEMDLLTPWSIATRIDGEEVKVDGLFHINEARFNSLEAEKLIALRDNGLLPVIYSQLLSTQNLSRIAARAPVNDAGVVTQEEIQFDFNRDYGSIRFDGM